MNELYWEDGSIYLIRRYKNKLEKELMAGCDGHSDEKYHLEWDKAVKWMKEYNSRTESNYKLLELYGDKVA